MTKNNIKIVYKDIYDKLFKAHNKYKKDINITYKDDLLLEFFYNKCYHWLDLVNKADSGEIITDEEVFDKIAGLYFNLGYKKELTFGERVFINDYLEFIIREITGMDYVVGF